MIIALRSLRLFCAAVAAGALTLSVTACTDNSPGGVATDPIPPNAATGPGNSFAPAGGAAGGATTGFPSNGGGNGASAPGH